MVRAEKLASRELFFFWCLLRSLTLLLKPWVSFDHNLCGYKWRGLVKTGVLWWDRPRGQRWYLSTDIVCGCSSCLHGLNPNWVWSSVGMRTLPHLFASDAKKEKDKVSAGDSSQCQCTALERKRFIVHKIEPVTSSTLREEETTIIIKTVSDLASLRFI